VITRPHLGCVAESAGQHPVLPLPVVADLTATDDAVQIGAPGVCRQKPGPVVDGYDRGSLRIDPRRKIGGQRRSNADRGKSRGKACIGGRMVTPSAFALLGQPNLQAAETTPE
jgi:hypothetical protein